MPKVQLKKVFNNLKEQQMYEKPYSQNESQR